MIMCREIYEIGNIFQKYTIDRLFLSLFIHFYSTLQLLRREIVVFDAISLGFSHSLIH